ncbi:MAG: DNA polymerase/3'-5' exonuclease PolX, partial [Candidatus Omnitrophica bacterium]|nr:DNA polymerase/3'-5' exonuclease PolX [Candidatus Omnitrophota bacterium]
MDKNRIAEILEEFAVLLELKSANVFRIRAFHNAARAIESTNEDLKKLAEEDELTKIPGIGKGISALIQDLFKKGKSKEHEKLKKSFPKGFLEILKIPGVGPKRAKILYEKLGVKNVAELQYACNENRLLKLNGFGEKSQANILLGIQHYMKTKGFFLVSQADEEANQFVGYLRKEKTVSQISVAGSLRRHKEIVHDVDILVSTKKHAAIHDAFTKYPEVEQVVAKGDTKSSVILKSGLQVDLRTVSDAEFPYALHYFTGSKEHNVAIRTIAKRRGYKINEYGLFKGPRLVPCKTEGELYQKLGFSYIEPELRENTGEIEAAEKGKLPKHLIEEKDIKGTFHIHSTYSDGRASLEDMVKKAVSLGYEYIGISDHSKSAAYANGLSEERVKKQQDEIDKLQKKYKTIRIFKGIESDILPDGSLDYPEKVLKNFDFIIGSVHS